MTKWNMILDVDRCNNCRNCFLSVLDEYAENEHAGYSAPVPRKGAHLMEIDTHERGSGQDLDVTYVPVTCNHCDDAPCMKAAEKGAVYKRRDGIVIIDPVKSKGQKQIAEACPFGRVYWNEELQIPQIWTFDAHLLDQGWERPRMADACPTLAIETVRCTDAEMESRARRENLRTLQPELGTKPRIYYRNLDRIFENFVSGSVLVKSADTLDIVEGAEVVLRRNDEETMETRTDFFGDFKFTGLPCQATEIEIEVRSGGKTVSRRMTLARSGRVDPFILEA